MNNKKLPDYYKKVKENLRTSQKVKKKKSISFSTILVIAFFLSIGAYYPTAALMVDDAGDCNQFVRFLKQVQLGYSAESALLFNSAAAYSGDSIAFATAIYSQDNKVFTLPTTKKWIIFGDSISNSLVDDYPADVIELIGLTGTETHAVNADRLTNQLDDLDTLLAGDPNYLDTFDVLSLWIGANDIVAAQDIGTRDDAKTDTTMAGYLKDFIETAQTANPNIKIYIITQPETDSVGVPYGYENPTYGWTFRELSLVFSQICFDYSVNCIDLYSLGNFNADTIATLTSDGVHPNATGIDVIAPIIANVFTTNTATGTTFDGSNFYDPVTIKKNKDNAPPITFEDYDVQSTATPPMINFGNSYASDTNPAKAKIQLIETGGAYGGFGVSASRMDYFAFAGAGHYFYVNGASVWNFRIESDGTLSVPPGAYESLVLDDDDIPNKKFCDDNYLTPVLTTKGDILTYSTLLTRLGVGADGQTLTADSSEATGLKWSTPAGAGDMLKATYDTGSDGKIDSAAGGTNIDTSASTGVASVSAGTWSILSTLTHELGGLEADVSAYSGLLKISGGATSQAVAGTDYAATRTGVYRTVWIDAGAMVPQTTNGAVIDTSESTTNKQMNDGFDFDAATDEYVQFKMSMPDNWGTGTIKIKYYWGAAGTAGAGDVIWATQAVAVSNDDAIDVAWGTAQTVTDTFIADGDMHITSATASITIAGTPAIEDCIYFRIYRDADDGSDTYTQDARLYGIKIQYQENSTESSAW